MTPSRNEPSARRSRLRCAALLLCTLAAALTPAAACADDAPAAQQQIQQQQSAVQPAQQTQQQTQPIDATGSPATPAQSAQPQQQQQQTAAQPQQQQSAPQQQQQTAAQEDAPAQEGEATGGIVYDPNRDTLIEGERLGSRVDAAAEAKQFRFQAAAGEWLRIHVDGKDGMDPILTLLQPDRTEIAVNDDLSNANRDSLLIAQVPSGGLQVIRVAAFDANSTGDFIIQVTRFSPGADDDNAVIQIGAEHNGRLNFPGDIDVVEFQAAAGEQITVTVDGDTGVDVLAQLFDPEGNFVTIDDDGGHGLDAEIYFTTEMDGVHRVEIWPAANGAFQRQLIGAYRVTVRRGLPTTDPADEQTALAMAGAAITFLQAMRDSDAATILALAGPEAITNWGWESTNDIERDLAKMQSIGLGGNIIQSVSAADALNPNRSRVYLQFEEHWMRFELIQLAGHWLIDDWAHSIGPPA